MKSMRRRPDFVIKQNAPQARFIKQNTPQARIFDAVLMGTLSYLYSMYSFFHKSQLKIFWQGTPLSRRDDER